MLTFFKYSITFLTLFILLIYYFFFTSMGEKSLCHFATTTLSKKSGLHLNVKSIDISHYPKVNIIMLLQKKAKLTLFGYIDYKQLDMNYTLTGDCIATELCTIDDSVNIRGDIKGLFTKLFIQGKGRALEGKVNYSAIKSPDKVENLHIDMEDINSSKLFKLMGEVAYITGKANAQAHFYFMNEKHKNGYFIYTVKNKNFKGIPLTLSSRIDILDNKHTFKMHINSDAMRLELSKGQYNQTDKIAKANYVLEIKEFNALESILEYIPKGKFYANGKIIYDKTVKITGISRSFEGLTDFTFEKNKLKIKLDNVLLEKISQLFPFVQILTANATGDIVYDTLKSKLFVNTKLKNAKFTPSKLVDIIHKKSGANMLKETFNHASLHFTYADNSILGSLKLANPHSHIYLNNTHIDTKLHTINAYFDFNMQKKIFSGKVYGRLDDPKVNLNMQKLIRREMDKQVDKMIGKDNREIMESMPMGDVAKDMATDMGASIMKVFF